MEILKTNELIKIDNPNPGERYRLDLVTGEQMASKLGGFLIILPPGREVPYHYHEKQESLILMIQVDMQTSTALDTPQARY